MLILSHLLQFAALALAARPFINEPDTGIDDALRNTDPSSLPDLSDIYGLPDFDWAARRYLSNASYTWYRTGAGGEWSYRNNLEVFGRITVRPRVLIDPTNVEQSLPTTILGYNFSAPFFISPAAQASFANPENAERGLVEAAGASNLLYVPSMLATLSIEQIAADRAPGQVLFQQLYTDNNLTNTIAIMRRAENSGYKAFVVTVDNPAAADRQRALRFGVYPEGTRYTKLTWDNFRYLQNQTSLPLVPKGITTVDDARLAVAAGAPAIFLSNHGGRQLDTSPSAMEVAIEIYEQAPEIFKQVEVYADGGVRYGTDVLKLLALGVRAVGIGRPFMYANAYGTPGVQKAIDLMKDAIATDAANLGVATLGALNASYIRWQQNNGWYS